MPRRTTDTRLGYKALQLVGDDGTTEQLLLFAHGIPREILDALVREGTLQVTTRKLVKPKMDVRVYHRV